MENHLPSLKSGRPIYQAVIVIITFLYLLTFQVCPTEAQEQLVQNCSQNRPQNQSHCIPGETWYNLKTGCCERCSTCDHGSTDMFLESRCNVSHDAVCACRTPLYFEPAFDRCVIHCPSCETGRCIPNTDQCECPVPANCYQKHDLYCRNGPILCEQEPVTVQPTRNLELNSPRETSLPPWGIGLIAIGVVIGIIVFASCFLCLGIFTITKNQDPESQSSDSSESGLVVRGSISSVGTETSYLSPGYPYLSSHSMLELLKNSNPQMLSHTGSGSSIGVGGGVSSVTSSPISIRGSPRPIRTIKLVKTSDKISAIVL